MKEIRIDRDNNRIVMTRKFAKKADDPHTREFRLLQEVMETYPSFRVENHTIRKNPNKECYRGLTYNYMRDYIRNNEAEANVECALSELEHLIEISQCHSSGYRYPTIKKWFLEKYEDVASFGKELEETEERKTVELSFPKEESVAA
jgi:hypothetical protein